MRETKKRAFDNLLNKPDLDLLQARIDSSLKHALVEQLRKDGVSQKDFIEEACKVFLEERGALVPKTKKD